MFPTLEIKFVGLCLMHLVFRQIRNVVNCLWAHTAFMIMLFYAFNGFYRAMVYSAITGGGKVKKAREGWVWSTQTPSPFFIRHYNSAIYYFVLFYQLNA